MKTNTCGECRYFNPTGDNGYKGECHANPPVIVERLLDKSDIEDYSVFNVSMFPELTADTITCRFFAEGSE